MDNNNLENKSNTPREYEESDAAVEMHSPLVSFDESQTDQEIKTKDQQMYQTMSASDDNGFSDVKQFMETPFTYHETDQVNVQLNNAAIQYQMEDFVLPGRDGFDVSIARRYDSGSANLVDMDPYVKYKKLRTGSRDNNHNIRTYGLGHGWSFVLPSVETIPWIAYYYLSIPEIKFEKVEWWTGYDYVLHLGDGRVLKIRKFDNSFYDYNLKDVTVQFKAGKISHPYNANLIKQYHMVVEYKNGNKDYFRDTVNNGNDRDGKLALNYKLAARQDRFGNMISYELADYGGMTIVDTWGRTIQLVKTSSGLTWNLPGAEPGGNYEITYQVERTGPMKLTAATDMMGNQTKFDYYNPDQYTGLMRYASEKAAGKASGDENQNYLLLKSITYPDQTYTHFEYGEAIKLSSGMDGFITRFPISVMKDIAGGEEYRKVEYSYEYADSPVYIKGAKVKKHQDIEENHKFLSNGMLDEREISHQGVLISKSKYTYKNKLMISAVDQILDPDELNDSTGNTDKTWLGIEQDPELKGRVKKTYWTYSDDRKADLIKEVEEYPDDPGLNQEITNSYGYFSIVIETTRKKGSDIVRETNDLDALSDNKVIKCHRVYENNILKEKTVYDYNDPQNPYCITVEKRYIANGTTDLEQSVDYAETAYTYNSSNYTHQYATKEHRRIQDADGKDVDPIKETYKYDLWGRVISKTDGRNQVTTIRYDQLRRIVEEIFPSPLGQTITNKTYYNDRYSYITQTDANNYKKRITYNLFGKVKQVCLAAADTPAAGDIVLQDYQYNTWGELVEVKSYDGTGTLAANTRKTEQYSYDSFGRVLSRKILQTGYEEQYHYEDFFVDPEDGMKYLLEQKTIKGDSNAPEVKTETYKDLKDQIRKEYLAGTRITTNVYDNAGNKVRILDAENRLQQWEYDYRGQVVKSIRTESGQQRSTRIEYDALGNKRYSWDENGKRTEYRCDLSGRLIQVIAPFDHRSQVTKYYYDGIGNIIREKKGQENDWREVRHDYDAAGRLINTWQYLSTTNWIRTCYQYDAMGNVTFMRAGDTPSGQGRQVNRYTYDRFGNTVTMTDASNRTEYYRYDRVGIKQEKTDRNGNKIVYQHDALDHLIRETSQIETADGLVTSTHEYTYSKNGKLVKELSRERAAGEPEICLESRYYYDNKGQLIRQEDPGDAIKYYTYDIHGNRQTFRLIRNGQEEPEINLYYVYDDQNRLRQVRRDGLGGMVLAEYTYDVKGNRNMLRYSKNGIETRYTYNEANRIIAMETKRYGNVIASWDYGYDINGDLLYKTNKSSASTITYRYDRLGRLAEEDHPGWKKVVYTYDAYSNRIKMMVEGRTREEPVSVTSYEYDVNNQLQKEVRKQGKVTETYNYCYDNNGNETFRIWEKTAPSPGYPGSVQLSASWKYDDPVVYEWRHYNGFDQLIRINQDAREIMYQYRVDGLRHSRRIRNLTDREFKTTVFYWDGDDIVAEQTNKHSIICYLRGVNLIARASNNMVYYYVLNEHGDVAELWSEHGIRKTIYEYDAFGDEKNPNPKDENAFRYCAEYFDVETKTVYLRARSYRTATGRFLTEDPYWHSGNLIYGDQERQNDKHIIDLNGLSWMKNSVIMPDIEAISQSANLYMYCMNNPIRYSDKNGEVALLAAMAIGAVAGAVISAGIELGMQLWKSKSLAEVEWGRVGIQAATGAVSGALAASSFGIVGQMVGNAAISGISNAATQKIYTGKINAFELGVSIGVGTVLGFVGGKGAYNGANKFSVSYVTQGSYLLRHDVIRYIDSNIAEKAVTETLKAITRSSVAGVLIEQIKGFTNQVVSRQNGTYLYN